MYFSGMVVYSYRIGGIVGYSIQYPNIISHTITITEYKTTRYIEQRKGKKENRRKNETRHEKYGG